MAAGSIIVDLLMRTGSFETDTKRAEKALKNLAASAGRIGGAIGVAVGAAAVATAALFDQLVKGAGQYQDLADMTGASAEALASYAVAAATAGVSMESVAGAMNKLTKGLTGVDDESKAAGAALGALGINVADFKKLDPAAQYEAIGKALSGFEEGAGKAAVAQALWGKAGAEQLKVFKALEDQGGADDHPDAEADRTGRRLCRQTIQADRRTDAVCTGGGDTGAACAQRPDAGFQRCLQGHHRR